MSAEDAQNWWAQQYSTNLEMYQTAVTGVTTEGDDDDLAAKKRKLDPTSALAAAVPTMTMPMSMLPMMQAMMAMPQLATVGATGTSHPAYDPNASATAGTTTTTTTDTNSNQVSATTPVQYDAATMAALTAQYDPATLAALGMTTTYDPATMAALGMTAGAYDPTTLASLGLTATPTLDATAMASLGMASAAPYDAATMAALLASSTTTAAGLTGMRYKTTMCRNWSSTGTCSYGPACQFAHGQHELSYYSQMAMMLAPYTLSTTMAGIKSPVDSSRYKTQLCKNWTQTGTCRYETTCAFAHGEQELHSR